MKIADQIREAWNPYLDSIRSVLTDMSRSTMPEEADFLWFVLHPQELEGFPVTVWPTERNQQQHDGWEHEYDLHTAVPDTVLLSDELTATVEGLDGLRDATADFMTEQWNTIEPTPDRLAYFSICDDGFYFSMRDGKKISAHNLEKEIGEQVGDGDAEEAV